MPTQQNKDKCRYASVYVRRNKVGNAAVVPEEERMCGNVRGVDGNRECLVLRSFSLAWHSTNGQEQYTVKLIPNNSGAQSWQLLLRDVWFEKVENVFRNTRVAVCSAEAGGR